MKRHHPLPAIILAAVTGLGSVSAASESPAKTARESPAYPHNTPRELYLFSIHDSNRDGVLNKMEYLHFIEQLEQHRTERGSPAQPVPPPLRFEVIDVNRDGNITEEEMITSLNKRLQQRRRYRGGR